MSHSTSGSHREARVPLKASRLEKFVLIAAVLSIVLALFG